MRFVLSSGDLEFGFMGSSRLTDGIRAHQMIQKSRPSNYTPELSVSYEKETQNCILAVSGRIDGVFENQKIVEIEEIKSTTRSLDELKSDSNPYHWAQLMVYAFIYLTTKNLDQVNTRLTYVNLESGKTKAFKEAFSFDALKTFFNDLSGRYVKWADKQSRWGATRDSSIENLEFPFAVYRAGQRHMAVEVFRTIRDQQQMIVQAATGIGKTMAAIYPSIKSFSQGLVDKIFYLTARTTGRYAAEKAIDLLKANGLRLKTVTITAKDKICFKPDASCAPDECEYAKGYYDRLPGALDAAFQKDTFTRTIITQICEESGICPFEFTLELCLWADCIICDYNYAFDPRVYLKRFFLEENGDYVFLVDEAHNMVDRAREMFSARIEKQVFLDLGRQVKDRLPSLYKSMGKINSWMVPARKKCEESSGRMAQKDPPESLYPLLRTFLKKTEKWLVKNIQARFRDELLELFFQISGFVKMADLYGENYSTIYETKEKNLSVKLFCIDPSRNLKAVLKRSRAVIFFSATMTPATYFVDILGCSKSAKKMAIPSPFPRRNLGVFISGTISTYYHQRRKTVNDIVKAIHSFVLGKKGNFLIFFPSYDYLQMVYAVFKETHVALSCIVQKPGMTEEERDGFLDRFSKTNSKSLIGFVVMGGIFGEGIDLVGEKLSGAVIVGVGLPAICLERDLIRNYYPEQDKGFEFAYLFPGMNRVLQAAGRVVRTENDKGALLLIDRRYATVRYRALLPSYWNKVSAPNPVLEKKVADFWAKHQIESG